jgi:hypothetical protein
MSRTSVHLLFGPGATDLGPGPASVPSGDLQYGKWEGSGVETAGFRQEDFHLTESPSQFSRSSKWPYTDSPVSHAELPAAMLVTLSRALHKTCPPGEGLPLVLQLASSSEASGLQATVRGAE